MCRNLRDNIALCHSLAEQFHLHSAAAARHDNPQRLAHQVEQSMDQVHQVSLVVIRDFSAHLYLSTAYTLAEEARSLLAYGDDEVVDADQVAAAILLNARYRVQKALQRLERAKAWDDDPFASQAG